MISSIYDVLQEFHLDLSICYMELMNMKARQTLSVFAFCLMLKIFLYSISYYMLKLKQIII